MEKWYQNDKQILFPFYKFHLLCIFQLDWEGRRTDKIYIEHSRFKVNTLNRNLCGRKKPFENISYVLYDSLSSQPATLRPQQHLKLKFYVMLHRANANFPVPDKLSYRAANIQSASEGRLYGCSEFKRQRRSPQSNGISK